MLPGDTKARKVAHLEKLRQTAVHDHYKPIPLEEKPQPYSDEIFKDAAIEWLIATDQVLIIL
jgi:hypothetical protein